MDAAAGADVERTLDLGPRRQRVVSRDAAV